MKKGLSNMTSRPNLMCPMTLLLSLAALTLIPAAGLYATPVAYNGIISLDTVHVTAGDHFPVSVRLANNTLAISGLTIPLRYASPYLSVDSVSFAGTLKPDNISGEAYIDAANGTIRISYLPMIVPDGQPLPSFSNTQGVLAKIFFRLDPTAHSITIEIDSINVDSIIAGTIHYWQRIEIADASGQQSYLPRYVPGAVVVSGSTGVADDIRAGLPAEFRLDQNYPNPFNPSTVISFSLPGTSQVRLDIFNVLGQSVTTLLDKPMSAGTHQVEFDAGGLPSGIYFYRLTHSGGSQTRKMILLK